MRHSDKHLLNPITKYVLNREKVGEIATDSSNALIS